MRSRFVLAVSWVGLFVLATVAVAQLGPGGTFGDDDGNVHEADIEAIAAEGITRGCNPPSNDRFCPDDPVTRGQMAAFLVRALGYTDAGAGDFFVDDDQSVFEGDIDRLRAAGVTFGCNPPSNDRFCPQDPVERDQMASFLTRALELTPVAPPPPTSSTSTTIPGDNACAGIVDVDDDLEVAAGTTCRLAGAAVGGNIFVRSGATLVASGVDVEGNIQAPDGHAVVTVASGSFVDGDIQAEGGGEVTVSASEIGGNIQLEYNRGSIDVTANTVDGDIQVNYNTGGVTIRDNVVGGNLQCQGNNPPPTGGGNDVSGDRENQCESL